MGHDKIGIMRNISLESDQKLASPVLAWTELPAKDQHFKQQLLKLKLFNGFNDL